MDKLTNAYKKYQENILVSILIIFYSVGSFAMLATPFRKYFLGLSSYNLLLSFLIAWIAIKNRAQSHVRYFIVCYMLSMISEWIGTSTGYLFGAYAYGKNLGTTIFGVPLVIGLNWWILLTGASSLVSIFKLPSVLSILAGALLTTLLDVLMEPVAVKSDFWTWENGYIPFYNYVCWFFLSATLLYIQQKVSKPEANKVHSALFIMITLFFALQILI